jgi:hypothetical protein
MPCAGGYFARRETRISNLKTNFDDCSGEATAIIKIGF